MCADRGASTANHGTHEAAETVDQCRYGADNQARTAWNHESAVLEQHNRLIWRLVHRRCPPNTAALRPGKLYRNYVV